MTLIVRRYHDDDAEDFAQLNLRWIEEMFGVEESDRQQLLDPQGSILDPGGVIAIAELDGEVVGCGALVPPHHSPDDGQEWLELVKMATDPDAQGKGVASQVMTFLIDEARARGCDALWLETNDRLGAATRLYERKGFQRLEGDELWPTPYQRCNLQMVLEL
ncbi:GNAT family N-acetyltransferase [Altererythrobacter arenosus]|uniref:GNAT family N-acetyltransferase n=1 Tax=Altererythrobacter arenosus TaxID=3032592 RepID=A0ABY8FV65_9SPHN|nr:GNAT family N-acetyltransferase [Altererythrobacter sp. CAU 1644]WFL77046.1 GNAT family N-acetyltransferase [Altererythrobacter sp. CAU 1644]